MSNTNTTDITLTHSESDATVGPEVRLYPQYRQWETAFRDLTGWPPEPVTENELRGQLASSFPVEGLKERSPEEAVPIEKAIQVGILKRNPAEQTLQLATVKTVGLDIGGRVHIWEIPAPIESDSSVSVERI
jgi:hypothetical protein